METNFPCELQRRLEQAIAAGKYAKGEVLTSSDLAGQFQVANDEMLMVLLAEHRKGLVIKREGEVFEVLGLANTGFDSVFTHTAKSGLKPSSDVRAAEIKGASPEIAEKLDLEVGAPVYRFVRTRYINGEALANQINYIPFEVCPGLEYDDFSYYSFQKLLEEKYFAVFTQMEEDLAIVPADPQDMEILNLPEGSSVLVVRRLAVSATGFPLVWADIRIRPDRYQYVAELWPSAADLLANKVL
ncbi:MAG: GntR family transcriptional regulator [Ardenticatenaceae bacterium]|nr:GntR family transcriptional regulator [Ardenticatenaceae bacterium]